VRQNPKARQAKSKARLQRYEELASREFQERNETNEIYIPPGASRGSVIAVSGLRKATAIACSSTGSPSACRAAASSASSRERAGKTTLFACSSAPSSPTPARSA